MSFDVICAGGHRLKVASRYAGKTIRCPKCSAAIDIPELDSVQASAKPHAPAVPPPLPKQRKLSTTQVPDEAVPTVARSISLPWKKLVGFGIGTVAVIIAVMSANVIRQKLEHQQDPYGDMRPAWKDTKGPGIEFTPPSPAKPNPSPAAPSPKLVVP